MMRWWHAEWKLYNVIYSEPSFRWSHTIQNEQELPEVLCVNCTFNFELMFCQCMLKHLLLLPSTAHPHIWLNDHMWRCDPQFKKRDTKFLKSLLQKVKYFFVSPLWYHPLSACHNACLLGMLVSGNSLVLGLRKKTTHFCLPVRVLLCLSLLRSHQTTVTLLWFDRYFFLVKNMQHTVRQDLVIFFLSH